ncbi:AzlD domain-containing protein [Geodermatophilus sp. URMC 64]
MSALWTVVLVVGALSLAFRLLPVLAVGRFGLSERTAELLRHAGTGAVAALVVLGVLGGRGSVRPDPAVLAAVVLGGVLAWRGCSTARVVVLGGCAHAVVAGAVALLG